MTMTNKLVFLSLLSTTVAFGCDVKQDLGETAGSSTGSAESGGTGFAETGMAESGPLGSTGSAESGVGSTGSAESGVLDTGGWGETGEMTTGGSGGPLGACDASDTMVRWDWTTIGPQELGYESLFVGVGDCAVQGEDTSGTQIGISLQCTLTGTRDDAPFEDEDIGVSLVFDVEGATPAELLPGLWPILRARFFVGPVGFDQTGERYVVLEQPLLPNDGEAPIIIATDSSAGLQPPAEHYPESWYNGPSFTVTGATCESGVAPECTQDVALDGGWLDLIPESIHATEAGSFGAPIGSGSYDLFVSSAWEAVGPCPPDFPTAEYAFVAFGATD